MKSAMPALRRRRRAAYARSVGTQVVDEERADRRRRRRRQDTAILAKLTCHPRLRPPSSPSPSRRPPRYRHSSRAGAAAADRSVGRRRALRIVMSCVPRAFVRLLARSFVQVFSNGSPIARSLAPLDGGIRWSERAGGACGGISGLYGLDGGRASVRSVRLGTRNERTKKQMLTLETPSFWQLWVKQFKAKRDLIVYGICNVTSAK